MEEKYKIAIFLGYNTQNFEHSTTNHISAFALQVFLKDLWSQFALKSFTHLIMRNS